MIGKYGVSANCNYKCQDGNVCGGKNQNTIYRLDYTKDKLCSASQKFEKVDSDGVIVYGAGITLLNPSGDGQNFVFNSTEGDSFNVTIVRNREGVVKGFKTFEDNPMYDNK